jgi:hypothetical protein
LPVFDGYFRSFASIGWIPREQRQQTDPAEREREPRRATRVAFPAARPDFHPLRGLANVLSPLRSGRFSSDERANQLGVGVARWLNHVT